jgi:hypothetical protein
LVGVTADAAALDCAQVRPHPGIWRIVHGCSVVYLLLLAGIAVQDRESAIHALQFIFPEVGDVKRQTAPGKLECEISPKVRPTPACCPQRRHLITAIVAACRRCTAA